MHLIYGVRDCTRPHAIMQFDRQWLPARAVRNVRGRSGPAREGGGHGVGVALLVVAADSICCSVSTLFTYTLHTESRQVFHQAGQHPPLLGAEVIAGDVGTMSTQYLDRCPVLLCSGACSSTSNQIFMPTLCVWLCTSSKTVLANWVHRQAGTIIHDDGARSGAASMASGGEDPQGGCRAV